MLGLFIFEVRGTKSELSELEATVMDAGDFKFVEGVFTSVEKVEKKQELPKPAQ